ncbi:hypothetical protein CAOG_009801 [Capsaspora owczarzaki ATCC 30864]|uniref:Uncharacterized protein n=1 Tax=Capsaspora owczarzaki (strain ATCC 30864) TaxID=595528 RepID=A0A0D2WQX7_CAPO3|nr:hypothetical protein CAOG_009801 [Capsaspora owczarzaki ATCC 30864]
MLETNDAMKEEEVVVVEVAASDGGGDGGLARGVLLALLTPILDLVADKMLMNSVLGTAVASSSCPGEGQAPDMLLLLLPSVAEEVGGRADVGGGAWSRITVAS